jgi:hypothetical protein
MGLVSKSFPAIGLGPIASALEIVSPDHTRQIRPVQVFTIVWMLAEVVVSLFSAWRARSPALLAFGGIASSNSPPQPLYCGGSDSAPHAKEGRAARIAGALLFVLAACVPMVSAVSLLGYGEPKPSASGIVILLLAAVMMPLLAREKRKLSRVTEVPR